jgi:hypothetical protein
MKRLIRFLLLAVLCAAASGCSAASKAIELKAQGEKTGVFYEIADGQPSARYSDLIINAHIKTHLEGHYIFESKKSLHGKAGYPFLLNIDGQSVTWMVEGQIENTPIYDAKGKRIADGGDGRLYSIEKRLRLSAGPHKIFLGLPEENYFKEINITLKEKAVHKIEFRPVYKRDSRRVQSFLHGLREFEVYLDGIPIQ